jgi:hypothetical protein
MWSTVNFLHSFYASLLLWPKMIILSGLCLTRFHKIIIRISCFFQERIESIAANIRNSEELEQSEEMQLQLQEIQDMVSVQWHTCTYNVIKPRWLKNYEYYFLLQIYIHHVVIRGSFKENVILLGTFSNPSRVTFFCFYFYFWFFNLFCLELLKELLSKYLKQPNLVVTQNFQKH